MPNKSGGARRNAPMILNLDKAKARGMAARKKGHDKAFNPYSHMALCAAWNDGWGDDATVCEDRRMK